MHRRLRRAGWAAGMAMVLIGGAAVSASAGELTGGDPAEVECVDQAASEAQAAAVATACDQDVEVLDARTEWDTVVAQSDGTMRMDISTGAVRTQVSGEWEQIDTAVVAGSGGLTVASPAMAMTFSDGSDGMPLATIERDGHTLSMDAPFALTEPVVDGSQVTYPEVLAGVDLVLTVNPDGTGFSEVLRVESPEAASDPALAELAFPVETSEGIEVDATDGGFAAVDGAGVEVFTSPVPVMWDSAADDLTAPQTQRLGTPSGPELAEERVAAPQEGDTVAEMETEVTGDGVTIVPDAEILTDEETVWPVYIDPGISGTRNEWTMIQSGYPDTVSKESYNFPSTQGMGRCSPAYDSGCSRESIFRLVYEFGGLGAIGAMDGADVLGATFRVFGTHSWSCTPTGVEAWWVAGVSAGTTWNNHAGSGWYSLLSSQSVAHKSNCGNQRWIEFDITRQLKGTADGNYSTLAVGLKATDESSMPNSWKRYSFDAQVSVEYNRAPTVTGMSMANPSASCVRGAARPVIRTASPTLRVSVADPDGQNVVANYGVYGPSGLVAKYASPAMASGGTAAYAVPAGVLKHGTIYEWHAQGSDTYGRWGAGGICEFEVDLVAPNVVPGVTPVTGQPAAYAEDAVAGGVGLAGKFALTTGGVTDIVTYRYSFDSDALNQSVTVASGAQIAITPTTAGTHRLYVQSVDRAGWTSPVKVYRFNVAFPGKDGLWSLDEGASAKAYDRSGNNNTLLVTGKDGWGPGMLADLAGVDTDRGLSFKADGENAVSAGPIVATNESFTVMAMVKPSALDGAARTAVSQDGVTGSGFTLGLRKDAGCAAATGCWTFSMAGEDAAVPTRRGQAVSTRPVVADEWVHLTAIHDAQAKTVSLYVCDPLDLDDPPPTPVSAAFTQTWNATGPLRLGEAKVTTPAESWRGGIDDVRVFRGVVDLNTVRAVCHASEG